MSVDLMQIMQATKQLLGKYRTIIQHHHTKKVKVSVSHCIDNIVYFKYKVS